MLGINIVKAAKILLRQIYMRIHPATRCATANHRSLFALRPLLGRWQTPPTLPTPFTGRGSQGSFPEPVLPRFTQDAVTAIREYLL